MTPRTILLPGGGWPPGCGHFSCAAPKPKWPRNCPTASKKICSAKSKASRKRSTAPNLNALNNCCCGSRLRRSWLQQFHFLTSLLRLRQICCHPRLVKPDSLAPSAKSEALLEQLEPLMDEGQKVLVFSQFVELLALLRPAIAERGWPIFYLAGSTENRGELVRHFQSAPGSAVFLISLKAGGFGLNLTAASYVVLFDPWWNPAVENQAIDRTHRIGQINK